MRILCGMIFAMKMIMENNWGWGKEKLTLFIDVQKVFDCAPRELLWRTLADLPYSVPPTLIRVIRSMYSRCASKVRKGQIEIDWFPIDTGVRQGDVLSPLSFILFMDKCIGDTTPQDHKEIFAYANGVAMIVDDIDELQDVARRWHARGKTEFMQMSRWKQEHDVYIR